MQQRLRGHVAPVRTGTAKGIGFGDGDFFAFTGGGAEVLFRDICQMGSLAGAAYLLHDNAGVLRRAQWEQKSHVEHKRKSLLD